MNRGIEATATGMIAAERWMDVTANNLANVSTTGFKRDGLSFTDMYERQMNADGGQGKALGTLGSGVTPVNGFTIMERGSISSTGNPLDVAIESEKGMFAVQTSAGTRYTRDGSFSVNGQRELVTGNGDQVLDRSGRPITLPLGKIDIGADGAVSVDGAHAADIGLWNGNFQKEGANLFSATGAAAADPSQIQVRQGAIEGSNVNPIDAMISMIAIGRSYELSQKSITSQDDMTSKLIQTLQ